MNKQFIFFTVVSLSLNHSTVTAQVVPATDAAVDTTGLRIRPEPHQLTFIGATPTIIASHLLLDSPPQFIGGEAAFQHFLQQNLRFPPLLLRAHVQGSTKVRFTVDATGDIRNPVVYKSLCQPWDDEVVRVVKLLDQKFQPATYNGERVAAPYSLSIPFSIK